MILIDIQQLLIVLLYLSLVIYGIIKFRLLSMTAKWIAAFFGFLLVSELASLFLAFFYRNNLVVFHIIPYFHHFLLSAIYYKFANTLKHKLYIKLSYIVFFLFALVNSIFFQPLNELPTVTILFQFILIIILVFMQNANTLNQKYLPPVQLNSSLWFNFANLIFYSFFLLYWMSFFVFLNGVSFPPELYFFVFLANLVLSYCYFKTLQSDILQRDYYKKYGY